MYGGGSGEFLKLSKVKIKKRNPDRRSCLEHRRGDLIREGRWTEEIGYGSGDS